MDRSNVNCFLEQSNTISRYIASLYPRGKAVGSIQELKRFKQSSRILIVGNGPSIRTKDDVRSMLLDKNFDKSGTIASAMLSATINYLLFEPYYTVNSFEQPLIEPEGIASYVTSRVISALIVKSLNNCRGSVSSIIANPQFPPNDLGYSEHIITNVYALNMFKDTNGCLLT